MSAAESLARTSRPARSVPWVDPAALRRSRLAVVPSRRLRASRVPFVALVTAILLGGVVGLLCFNTSLQQAAFTESQLDTQADRLAAREQSLEMQLEKLRDPQRLAVQAQKQGLVIPDSVGMLDLRTGEVTGQPAPATRDSTPRLYQAYPRP